MLDALCRPPKIGFRSGGSNSIEAFFNKMCAAPLYWECRKDRGMRIRESKLHIFWKTAIFEQWIERGRLFSKMYCESNYAKWKFKFAQKLTICLLWKRKETMQFIEAYKLGWNISKTSQIFSPLRKNFWKYERK